METLDELVFIVNETLGVDICDYGRKFPAPWAKTFYTVLAQRYTELEPMQIMNRIGLDRSSFYSKIQLHEDLYKRDKEYTDMFIVVLKKTFYLKDAHKELIESQKRNQTLIQSQLKKLRYLASEFEKKRVLSNIEHRSRLIAEMREALDILDKLELKRINNDL